MMDFSDALRAAKAGKKIARKGWNGKKMWVAFTPGSWILKEQARAGAAQHLADETEVSMQILPHLDMKAADGSLAIGWLASQTDLLAEDWEVLP